MNVAYCAQGAHNNMFACAIYLYQWAKLTWVRTKLHQEEDLN